MRRWWLGPVLVAGMYGAVTMVTEGGRALAVGSSDPSWTPLLTGLAVLAMLGGALGLFAVVAGFLDVTTASWNDREL